MSAQISRSEVAVIEVLEKICPAMLQYKIHKDKEGLARFSREESLTMETLKKLKERGVKVELGMPYEMWDEPSAEITQLRQDCELIVAQNEDDLTEWFLKRKKDQLQDFLCRSRFLKDNDDFSCLPPASPNDEL